MRDPIASSAVLLLIISMLAGCLEGDVVENDDPGSIPITSSMTLYPMNGTNYFQGIGKNTTCLHHDDDEVYEMHGSCFFFYVEFNLMEFEPAEVPPGDPVITNATLQIEYRNNFITPENSGSLIKAFSWSAAGINSAIHWTPIITDTDIVDNITLFSNESMTMEDLSTFTLHFKVRAGAMGAHKLFFDRIVLIVDYSTNSTALR